MLHYLVGLAPGDRDPLEFDKKFSVCLHPALRKAAQSARDLALTMFLKSLAAKEAHRKGSG
jgi:hypothetical protein